MSSAVAPGLPAQCWKELCNVSAGGETGCVLKEQLPFACWKKNQTHLGLHWSQCIMTGTNIEIHIDGTLKSGIALYTICYNSDFFSLTLTFKCNNNKKKLLIAKLFWECWFFSFCFFLILTHAAGSRQFSRFRWQVDLGPVFVIRDHFKEPG